MKVKGRWLFNSTVEIGRTGDPMLTRTRIIQTPLFGLYLHKMHRPDEDRALHDHPWSFITWIVKGGYIEQCAFPKNGVYSPFFGKTRVWTRNTVHRMHKSKICHRIIHVEPGTVSLVLVGPKVREWGFYGRTYPGSSNVFWMPWRKYLGIETEPMVP